MKNAFKSFPVVTLRGPRQCGKTTLARYISSQLKESIYYDLEDPRDLAALSEPDLVLRTARGLVVLDEIQRRSDLLPLIRVLADRDNRPARFLLLGSASLSVVRGASESLAGRTAFIDMEGFRLSELSPDAWQTLWLRGGFPPAYLAQSDPEADVWKRAFVRAIIERDLPQLGVKIPGDTLSRFWTMLAHYHGQVFNASELGRALGAGHNTVFRYLDILSGFFLVRVIRPWYENLGKRLVKAPKVYIRDSGILHFLLGIADRRSLFSHPKLGASWEGFALSEVLDRFPGVDVHYYATHGGAELDLLLHYRGKRWGFEMKWNQAPVFTKSMKTALDDLKLERLFVVYPGEKQYPIHEKANVIPLVQLNGLELSE